MWACSLKRPQREWVQAVGRGMTQPGPPEWLPAGPIATHPRPFRPPDAVGRAHGPGHPVAHGRRRRAIELPPALPRSGAPRAAMGSSASPRRRGLGSGHRRISCSWAPRRPAPGNSRPRKGGCLGWRAGEGGHASPADTWEDAIERDRWQPRFVVLITRALMLQSRMRTVHCLAGAHRSDLLPEHRCTTGPAGGEDNAMQSVEGWRLVELGWGRPPVE